MTDPEKLDAGQVTWDSSAADCCLAFFEEASDGMLAAVGPSETL